MTSSVGLGGGKIMPTAGMGMPVEEVIGFEVVAFTDRHCTGDLNGGSRRERTAATSPQEDGEAGGF
ncbi:hypothetical protein E2562_026120 [Oryza meyeriana var. granulata]|uniref:Uncharacterized protein n=1 Tax=Oryza meyeriana var. granulata TaxID=110450 RepID=A0A6G1BYV4_9ORYZ|nr:hypothetical protein E2562_026120 [Oryza meyeriana var. granulata]